MPRLQALKRFSRGSIHSCLTNIKHGKVNPLPNAPKWLNSQNAEKLQEAELLSKNLGLYAWLSFNYPELFPKMAELPRLRHAVSRFIERTLLKQKGFSQLPRRSHRRGYGYGDDYFGFDDEYDDYC